MTAIGGLALLATIVPLTGSAQTDDRVGLYPGYIDGSANSPETAALNIAHEFLSTKVGGSFDMAEIKRRMNRMETVIDQAMSEQAKLF